MRKFRGAHCTIPHETWDVIRRQTTDMRQARPGKHTPQARAERGPDRVSFVDVPSKHGHTLLRAQIPQNTASAESHGEEKIIARGRVGRIRARLVEAEAVHGTVVGVGNGAKELLGSNVPGLDVLVGPCMAGFQA